MAGFIAIEAIIAERRARGPFSSIFDFCERVDLRAVNKATIEALVKSGAMDSMHGPGPRAAVFAAVRDAIAAGQKAAEDRRAGQMSFFGGGSGAAAAAGPVAATTPNRATMAALRPTQTGRCLQNPRRQWKRQ